MAKIVRRNTLISEKVTVSDAYELFLGSRKISCAEQTYKIYQDLGRRFIVRSLTELTEHGYMDEITTVVLRTSINDYAQEHTKGGESFLYRHLKAFINWYWDENDIPTANPIRKVKIKKVSTPPKKGITREEINKILKAAKDLGFPERDTAMILLLYDTGMRLSSLLGFKIKDVNIFPKHMNSIIQMKGFLVCDRWDLTLECIRRYYKGVDSPLYKFLLADKFFFDLFVDFRGYVDYFFFQDCVTDDYSKVIFWNGNGSLKGNKRPQFAADYKLWIERELDFLDKRNQRIRNSLLQTA